MAEPTMFDIAVQLARIEQKQDALLETTATHLAADQLIHTDHEQRIRSNERARWRMTGYAASVAALVSIAVPFIAKAFTIGG